MAFESLDRVTDLSVSKNVKATLMEDLVAVAVGLDTGDVRYFITWGRIQHPVDPKPLARLILEQCHRFALGGTARTVRICATLQEAAQHPLFYEALFSFAQRPIPFGPEYQQWREGINIRMYEGKELYLLGVPNSDSTSRTRSHASKKRTKAMKHCCEVMTKAISQRCDDHETVFECPDALIYYSQRFGEYGIIIHDGGTSYRTIDFCPWCGTKLPASKHDL